MRVLCRYGYEKNADRAETHKVLEIESSATLLKQFDQWARAECDRWDKELADYTAAHRSRMPNWDKPINARLHGYLPESLTPHFPI